MLTMVRVVIVAFVFGIFFYIDYQTITSPTQVTTEGRNLTEYPAAPADYVATQLYFKDLDSWAADRMHYRQQFITYLNYIRFRLGVSNFGKVIVGKEHWLFLDGSAVKGEKEGEDARGTIQFSAAELHRWKSYLRYRNAEVKAHGGRFIFFVVPNKSTVYPEYLPDNFQILSGNTRLQQLTDAMRDTDVTMIDLRPVFSEAKKHAPLYPKNETHWNMLGANYAQYAVVQELSKTFPDITPTLFPFHYGRQPEDNILVAPGDLYRMLGFYDDVAEPNFIVVDNVGACVGKVNQEALRQWPLSVGDCAKAGNQQNDPVWFNLLGTRWGHLEVAHRNFLFKSSINTQKKYSVFVQHDSFFEMLQPFFSNQFQYVHYSFLGRPLEKEVWSGFLDALNPDIVIEEIVERGLKNTVPRIGLDYPNEYDMQM